MHTSCLQMGESIRQVGQRQMTEDAAAGLALTVQACEQDKSFNGLHWWSTANAHHAAQRQQLLLTVLISRCNNILVADCYLMTLFHLARDGFGQGVGCIMIEAAAVRQSHQQRLLLLSTAAACMLLQSEYRL